MEYNIRFFDRKIFFIILISGMLFSLIMPIYMSRNFGLNPDLVGILIPSGIVLTFIIAYIFSKHNEYFIVDDGGLFTKKYGMIKWGEIYSFNLDDYNGYETLTIRLRNKKKISYACKINESTNREKFIEFRRVVLKKISEANKCNNKIVNEKSLFDGKAYRFIGYFIILVLILFTPYVVYILLTEDFSFKKFNAIIIVYGSALPFLFRVFREGIVKNKKY